MLTCNVDNTKGTNAKVTADYEVPLSSVKLGPREQKILGKHLKDDEITFIVKTRPFIVGDAVHSDLKRADLEDGELQLKLVKITIKRKILYKSTSRTSEEVICDLSKTHDRKNDIRNLAMQIIIDQFTNWLDEYEKNLKEQCKLCRY